MKTAAPSDTDSLFFAATQPADALAPFDSAPGTGLDSDFGLPADRAARYAARRAFVELKQSFMRAVSRLSGRKGEWLKLQVRQSNEPLDLWLLRGPVLAALRDNDPMTRALRADLYRELDARFPQGHADTSQASQPRSAPLPQPWIIHTNLRANQAQHAR